MSYKPARYNHQTHKWPLPANHERNVEGPDLFFLHWAIKENNHELVCELLTEGNINTKYDNVSPLFVAVYMSIQKPEEDRLNVIGLLLENGANVNEEESGSKITPLMKAATAWALDLVCLLLKYKADVNQQNRYGETALAMVVHKFEANEQIDHNSLIIYDILSKKTRQLYDPKEAIAAEEELVRVLDARRLNHAIALLDAHHVRHERVKPSKHPWKPPWHASLR
jgi:hypothetical protein